MPVTVADLMARLSLDTSGFSLGLSTAEGRLQATGVTLTRIGTALSAMILPLAGIATASVAMAATFERSMVKVVTLSGVAEGMMAKFREEILRLGPAVGRTPDELARGLLVVTSTGIRGAEAMEILTAASKASAIGLGEIKDISRVVTAAMTAYGKENLSAARATDILFQATVEGGAEAEQFAGSLGRVIGIAAQAGVSFEEVTGFIATFTRLGVNAEEATTALRGALSTLIAPGAEARDLLSAMGTGAAQLRAEIKDKGLTEVLIGLVKQFGGNIDMLEVLIPNIRALSGVLGVAGSQSEAAREVLENIKKSAGSLDEAFTRTRRTTATTFDEFKIKVVAAGIALGDNLAPFFVAALRTAEPFFAALGALARAFGALPGPVQGAILVLGAFASGGALASVAIGRLLPLLPALAAGFRLVTGALLGPVGLAIVLGITVVGALGSYFASSAKAATGTAAMGAAVSSAGKSLRETAEATKGLSGAAEGLAASSQIVGDSSEKLTAGWRRYADQLGKVKQEYEGLLDELADTKAIEAYRAQDGWLNRLAQQAKEYAVQLGAALRAQQELAQVSPGGVPLGGVAPGLERFRGAIQVVPEAVLKFAEPQPLTTEADVERVLKQLPPPAKSSGVNLGPQIQRILGEQAVAIRQAGILRGAGVTTETEFIKARVDAVREALDKLSKLEGITAANEQLGELRARLVALQQLLVSREVQDGLKAIDASAAALGLTAEQVLEKQLALVQGRMEKLDPAVGANTTTLKELQEQAAGLAAELFNLQGGAGESSAVFRGLEEETVRLGGFTEVYSKNLQDALEDLERFNEIHRIAIALDAFDQESTKRLGDEIVNSLNQALRKAQIEFLATDDQAALAAERMRAYQEAVKQAADAMGEADPLTIQLREQIKTLGQSTIKTANPALAQLAAQTEAAAKEFALFGDVNALLAARIQAVEQALKAQLDRFPATSEAVRQLVDELKDLKLMQEIGRVFDRLADTGLSAMDRLVDGFLQGTRSIKSLLADLPKALEATFVKEMFKLVITPILRGLAQVATSLVSSILLGQTPAGEARGLIVGAGVNAASGAARDALAGGALGRFLGPELGLPLGLGTPLFGAGAESSQVLPGLLGNVGLGTVTLGQALGGLGTAFGTAQAIQQLVAGNTAQGGFGLGAIGLGAGIGSIVPGLGTIAGAGLGALVSTIFGGIFGRKTRRIPQPEAAEGIRKISGELGELLPTLPTEIVQRFISKPLHDLQGEIADKLKDATKGIDPDFAKAFKEGLDRISTGMATIKEFFAHVKLLGEQSARIIEGLATDTQGLLARLSMTGPGNALAQFRDLVATIQEDLVGELKKAREGGQPDLVRVNALIRSRYEAEIAFLQKIQLMIRGLTEGINAQILGLRLGAMTPQARVAFLGARLGESFQALSETIDPDQISSLTRTIQENVRDLLKEEGVTAAAFGQASGTVSEAAIAFLERTRDVATQRLADIQRLARFGDTEFANTLQAFAKEFGLNVEITASQLARLAAGAEEVAKAFQRLLGSLVSQLGPGRATSADIARLAGVAEDVADVTRGRIIERGQTALGARFGNVPGEFISQATLAVLKKLIGEFAAPSLALTLAELQGAGRFQTGGLALLEPGEFVVRREAAARNLGALQALNEGGTMEGGRPLVVQVVLDGRVVGESVLRNLRVRALAGERAIPAELVFPKRRA